MQVIISNHIVQLLSGKTTYICFDLNPRSRGSRLESGVPWCSVIYRYDSYILLQK